MEKPFLVLGFKRWREFKTSTFLNKVMLIIIFNFGNNQVRLMINKPTGLSIHRLPEMPLFSSSAIFLVNFVRDARGKKCAYTRGAF
jgi:hypothetical protein